MTDVQGEWPAADAVLDTSGLNCPLPLLKAKLELNRLASGAVLQVTATDAGGLSDDQAVAITVANVNEAPTSATLPVTIFPATYNPMVGTTKDDNITGTDSNDIIVADVAGLNVVQGKNYNIAFMVDTSGSMDTSISAAKNSLSIKACSGCWLT